MKNRKIEWLATFNRFMGEVQQRVAEDAMEAESDVQTRRFTYDDLRDMCSELAMVAFSLYVVISREERETIREALHAITRRDLDEGDGDD